MASFGGYLQTCASNSTHLQYSLDKVMKVGEGGGLPDTRNLIFDVVKEAVIKVVPEATFFVTLDL